MATYATLVTSLGDIKVRLLPETAPKTVENFVGLANGTKEWTDPSGKAGSGSLYAGTIFHRVIPNFMIQGGDPTGTGRGDAGYVIPDEFVAELRHDRAGLLSMANRGPTTGSAQFFITLGPTPHLDDKHTIFGRCTDASVKVAETIAATGGEGDRPTTPQTIEKLEILRN